MTTYTLQVSSMRVGALAPGPVLEVRQFDTDDPDAALHEAHMIRLEYPSSRVLIELYDEDGPHAAPVLVIEPSPEPTGGRTHGIALGRS